MTQEQDTTEQLPVAQEWATDEQKVSAYKKARLLVNKRCGERSEAWREEAAWKLYERWLSESTSSLSPKPWLNHVVYDSSAKSKKDVLKLGRAEAFDPATIVDAQAPAPDESLGPLSSEECVRRLLLAEWQELTRPQGSKHRAHDLEGQIVDEQDLKKLKASTKLEKDIRRALNRVREATPENLEARTSELNDLREQLLETKPETAVMFATGEEKIIQVPRYSPGPWGLWLLNEGAPPLSENALAELRKVTSDQVLNGAQIDNTALSTDAQLLAYFYPVEKSVLTGVDESDVTARELAIVWLLTQGGDEIKKATCDIREIEPEEFVRAIRRATEQAIKAVADRLFKSQRGANQTNARGRADTVVKNFLG